MRQKDLKNETLDQEDGMQILVYGGEGVSSLSLSEILKLFKKEKLDVIKVDASFLNETDWETRTRLLVFPGGRDKPYDQALKSGGTKRIRTFVKEGGHFLGICAGAYFASSEVIFEKGTPLEVHEKRELQFFPGAAVGALYPETPFSYDSEQGARGALIGFEDMHLHVYYNGGCRFDQAETMSNAAILGRFLDRNNQAAIVRCHVEKGKAILSGVHVELSGDALQANGRGLHLKGVLQQSEHKRQKVLRSLLIELV